MPNELKSNESNLRFFCAGFPGETFRVVDYKGVEAISHPYSLRLTLLSSNHAIDQSAAKNKPASFFIFRNGLYYPYSGVVRNFSYVSCDGDHSKYTVELVPRLTLLGYQRKTDLSRKMNYPDVLKKLLESADLLSTTTFDLSRQYPVKEHVQQEGESDLNFFSRLIEEAGMWYLFNEPAVSDSKARPGGSVEKLIISDKPSSFTTIDGANILLFRGRTGMVEMVADSSRESVHDLAISGQPVPASVMLGNYNSDTPDIKLVGKSAIKGGNIGMVYNHGTFNFRTMEEAQQTADTEANRFASRQIAVTGNSNCRGLRAGRRFTISEHPRKELNGIFVATSVSFHGSSSGAAATYSNSFSAIPGSLSSLYAPQRTAVKPKQWFKMAVVEANGSQYPLIDDQGRILIRFLDDISGAKNASASKYVRMTQTMAGPGTGVQFPLHEGTVVIVGFIGGDPDRPIIIGAVPNAATIPPVKGENKTENIIKTSGGNQFVMGDEEDKQYIKLLTIAKQLFEMNVAEKYLALQSETKSFLKLDDKNTRTELTRGKHNIVLSEKSGEEGVVITTAGGHVIKVDDKNKSISIQSAAGGSIQIDDNKKSIVMSDANKKSTVTLDGSKGIVLDTKGDISISATGKLTMAAASIGMAAQSGAVDLNAKAGALNLSAMGATTLASKTGAVNIKGMNVNVNGTQNVAIKATMNASVSGQVGAKLEGLKVDVKGTAMTSVAGTIVKIN